jgi:hypothetical protein
MQCARKLPNAHAHGMRPPAFHARRATAKALIPVTSTLLHFNSTPVLPNALPSLSHVQNNASISRHYAQSPIDTVFSWPYLATISLAHLYLVNVTGGTRLLGGTLAFLSDLPNLRQRAHTYGPSSQRDIWSAIVA